ncbi:putative uncharacterized protein DDB_G0292292 [Ostrinia nubilalis]|uniref:putative uncharacterized protein DDB_G0292292 n=1 Tax=Ostrinia nubilalis TaxID=29057 RepID=UPI003082328C
MLIKIVHLVILFFILTTVAARHSRRDYYSDESSESEEEPRPCGKARCRVYPKQRRQGYPAIKYEEKEDKADNRRADESSGYRRKEDLGDSRRNDDNQQSNAFDIVKLLSLFANGNKGETKVSFNIRDIQSGFSNAGSKYRVGNVHREVNRQKRDAKSELNDVATLSNGGIETGLVETSDTSTDIAKTENNVNSKELSVQPSAENAQVINDNKSVDANVSHTEADNFQDFNATNIHDFAANDSTSVPVNETASDDFNNEQLLTKEPNKEDNNNSINETSQVDNSNHYLERSSSDSFNQSENNVSRIGLVRDAEEISNNESNDEINTSQSQPPKVKIPLSRKDLSNIQSTLNDEFGVPSNGANPVANFALNPLNNKKQVIVIVYNCTCGKNNPHSHEKSIDDAVLINNGTDINNDDTNNNDEDLSKVILNTRRMIPSDSISSAQIEEEPTEENVENTNSENKPNYAQLENNMLKECTSLLALQTKNKVDEETNTNSENTTTVYKLTWLTPDVAHWSHRLFLESSIVEAHPV